MSKEFNAFMRSVLTEDNRLSNYLFIDKEISEVMDRFEQAWAFQDVLKLSKRAVGVEHSFKPMYLKIMIGVNRAIVEGHKLKVCFEKDIDALLKYENSRDNSKESNEAFTNEFNAVQTEIFIACMAAQELSIEYVNLIESFLHSVNNNPHTED